MRKGRSYGRVCSEFYKQFKTFGNSVKAILEGTEKSKLLSPGEGDAEYDCSACKS